ncbi:MAG: hypothetical protein WC007_01985 [Pelobacteraceae bacterium]
MAIRSVSDSASITISTMTMNTIYTIIPPKKAAIQLHDRIAA